VLGRITSYVTWPEAPTRLVRRGDQVFLLYANQLLGFAVSPETGTLEARPALTLGPPYPLPKPPDQPGPDRRVYPPYATDVLSGVVIFDYLFRHGDMSDTMTR
jgi:hypothetical protein